MISFSALLDSTSAITLAVPTLVFLSFGFLIDKAGVLLQKTLTILASLTLYYYIYNFYTRKTFDYFIFSLIFILIPLLIFSFLKIKSRRLSLVILMLYVLFEITVTFFGNKKFISLNILNFFRPLLIFTVYIFESRNSTERLTKLDKFVFLLNPGIFILAAFGIRTFKEQKQTRRLYILGVKNLLLSIIATVILKRLDNSTLLLNPIPFFLLSSFRYFLYIAKFTYYFFGLMQISGFNIKNPYELPFLATNPVDRWSRTSVYTSLWLKNYIFIPAYMHLKSLSISLGVLFLFNTLIHLPNEFFFYRHRSDGRILSTATNIALEFFLHGLIIFLYLKFFQKYNRDSWTNVLCTYFIMSMVYTLRY